MKFNELKTDQDVFNFVKTHLLTQNSKSKSVDNTNLVTCMYRGENNAKCAVGCLIADKFYTSELEWQSYNRIIEASVRKSIGFSPNPTMLAALQCLHDNDPIQKWETNLNRIEKTFFGKEF